MSLTITVLGCGNSTGVPAIGNYWGKCDPEEPKNNRTRSSILVQSNEDALVVDTGPDFKSQINRCNISALDAILYSHAHSDHVAGIEDLRAMVFLNDMDQMPIYGDQATIDELNYRFNYLFSGGDSPLYPPILKPHIFKEPDFGAPQAINSIKFMPFVQDHGTVKSVGYRFGDFGYSVDILDLDDQAVKKLKGIKTWLVDCAGYGQKNNLVHANFEKIKALNAEIGAQDVYLTSLTLACDYQTLLKELPKGYQPAYDGLAFQAQA